MKYFRFFLFIYCIFFIQYIFIVIFLFLSVDRGYRARVDSETRLVAVREIHLPPAAGPRAVRQEEVPEGGLHAAAGGRDRQPGGLPGLPGAHQRGRLPGRRELQGHGRQGRRRELAQSATGGHAVTPTILRALNMLYFYSFYVENKIAILLTSEYK